MPLYSFVCFCGFRDQLFSKITDRNAARICPCGQPLRRIMDAPYVRPEIPPYISPVTGEWVNSRAQRRDDLARTNSLEWEPGIREDCERRRLESLEANYRAVEATIDKTVAEMNASNLFSGDPA